MDVINAFPGCQNLKKTNIESQRVTEVRILCFVNKAKVLSNYVCVVLE